MTVKVVNVGVEEAVQFVTDHAWEDVHGCDYCDHVCSRRMIIHTFNGMFGADWDVAEAVKFIRASERRGLVRQLFGHNLAVQGDSGVVFFDVPLAEEASGG
jgi:hypothetical protein